MKILESKRQRTKDDESEWQKMMRAHDGRQRTKDDERVNDKWCSERMIVDDSARRLRCPTFKTVAYEGLTECIEVNDG